MIKELILIIDDESAMRRLLEITLESNGYKVVSAANAKEGMMMATSHMPDLILLDLGLPDLNGHDLLVRLREWYLKPIFILSVLGDETNVVKALDNGANDYLFKPFRSGELLARLRSALRNVGQITNLRKYEAGALLIDYTSRQVFVDEKPIKLTATEYALLILLAKNEGRVLTHRHILNEIWGQAYADQTQYLRVFIAQIRKKIESDANRPEYIITVSGIGYRFTTGQKSL